LLIRQRDAQEYGRESGETGAELSRIAQVAYQEGEIGVLELLDAYRVNRQSQLHLLELQESAKEAAIELDHVVGEEVVP
jgi:outer membrane protein, heavy metal efflux system